VAGISLSSLLIQSKSLSRDQHAGFTLLELLIVIFIISLISAGFIKLSLGFASATQSLEDETRRLHRLLDLTAQRSILRGGAIGLLIEANAYHFVSRGRAFEWVTFDGDDMLQHHQLPQGWHLELRQYDKVVPPVVVNLETDETEAKVGQPPPAIVFYDSGEITPFQLRIYAIDIPDPFMIEAKENGEIKMHLQALEE